VVSFFCVCVWCVFSDLLSWYLLTYIHTNTRYTTHFTKTTSSLSQPKQYPFLLLDLEFILPFSSSASCSQSTCSEKRIEEWIDKKCMELLNNPDEKHRKQKRHSVLSFEPKDQDEIRNVAPCEIARIYAHSQLELAGIPKMDQSRFDFLIQTICNAFPRWKCVTSNVFQIKHCESFESNRRRDKPLLASCMRFLQLAVDEDDEFWTPKSVKRAYHAHRRWYDRSMEARRLRQLSDGLRSVLAWKNAHLRERTLLVRYGFMWIIGSVFAPVRFHLFENKTNMNMNKNNNVEDIGDGVSFNIDGNVADVLLGHENQGGKFLNDMCSSKAFRVAAKERIGMNHVRDSFDAFCVVEIHHQLRMHWHRNLITTVFDASCFVLNMKEGGWNLIRSSLLGGSRSWRHCIMTVDRNTMRIRLFHASKALVEKRNAEAKLRNKIYSESQIDERLDLEYIQYELETLLSKNALEAFSMPPNRDWRIYYLPPRRFLPRHIRASKDMLSSKQTLKTAHGIMILNAKKGDDMSSQKQKPFVVCFESEKARYRFVQILKSFKYNGADRCKIDTAYLVGQNIDVKDRIQRELSEMASTRVQCMKDVVFEGGD